MAFPKLPDLIPPPPTGPTFDPNTYQNLVRDTLAPGQADLDGLQAQIDALKALTAEAELEVPGWVVDFDEVDFALGDIGDIQWGSPEPDFGPVTDYLTAQRDGIVSTIANRPAIAPVPIIGPDGNPVITVGAPPAQGGEPVAGSAPYVLHHPIPFSFDPARLVGGAILTGPNPPFVKLNGFNLDNPAKGTGGWAALIEINPARAGSFNASLVYSLAITITGINTIVKYNIAVLVVVQ